MRFVHFADLHLDAPFRRLPPAAARARRQALRTTLESIIQLARRERADALFCAGDLFEAERLTADTAAWLRERFAGAGLPVFIAPGNHDWLGPTTPYGALPWPANVHVFRSPRPTAIELAPGLLLHGAAHLAPSGTTNLLADFCAPAGAISVALFHGSERASFPFQGRDKGHHAPFDASEISVRGLAHAFVGHYHMASPEAPHHTYPGNPDPLSFGEDGPVRGAVIADIDGAGAVTRRWATVATSLVHALTVDVDGCAHRDALIERVRHAIGDLSGAIRVRLRGAVAPELDLDLGSDLDPDALGLVRAPERALIVEADELRFAYDHERLMAEHSVRGELVRRVMADAALNGANEIDRSLVLRLALNALADRDDLEVC